MCVCVWVCELSVFIFNHVRYRLNSFLVSSFFVSFRLHLIFFVSFSLVKKVSYKIIDNPLKRHNY